MISITKKNNIKIMSSEEDLDDIPDDLNIYAGKSYDRINDFFNDDDDLDTVDLQSTIGS